MVRVERVQPVMILHETSVTPFSPSQAPLFVGEECIMGEFFAFMLANQWRFSALNADHKNTHMDGQAVVRITQAL